MQNVRRWSWSSRRRIFLHLWVLRNEADITHRKRLGGLQTLFNRANVLRMKSEFDKAAEVYEKILQSSDREAEAYWGLILCKYGIEYVENLKTFKRIPSYHQASLMMQWQ